MRPYRTDRLTKAWDAIKPESVHPLVKFVGLVLLGLVGGIPCMILILIARVIKWILVALYTAGEKTYLSLQILANDPDR